MKVKELNEMTMDEVTYYLLLTTAVTPLLWTHYFLWLFGPLLFIYCAYYRTAQKVQPLILLCTGCFLEPSLAWLGAMILPATVLIVSLRNAGLDLDTCSDLDLFTRPQSQPFTHPAVQVSFSESVDPILNPAHSAHEANPIQQPPTRHTT